MTRTAVELLGKPDGPAKFVPELGCEVETFKQPAEKPCLTWHVPLEMRGDFRPTDLANYSPEKPYRTNSFGKVLCYAKTKTGGEYCERKAVNRYPRCVLHGGSLHPLDKVATDKDRAENESLTRYQQFKAKLIDVEELDDEELALCGFRSPKNGVVYRPKNIPREVTQAFQKALFDRATKALKAGVVGAANTLVDLATDSSVENSVRLKAAQDILDRNLGKATQVVSITTDAPWEEVFSAITTVSRDESRAARAIESSRVPSENALDVEVVPETNDATPNDEARQKLSKNNEAIINPVIDFPSIPYNPKVPDIIEDFYGTQDDSYSFDYLDSDD